MCFATELFPIYLKQNCTFIDLINYHVLCVKSLLLQKILTP